MTHTQAETTVLISNISRELKVRIDAGELCNPAMIGIHTGGTWVAMRIHQQLELETPLGELNISFYRDDFSRKGMQPQVSPSHLPFKVDDRHIILVDDVLYTGRTIRAALNEIFDYGRPATITLVVLAMRDGRELPIQADVVGSHFELESHQQIKLQGPDPLSLRIMDI
ncbi:MAG: bifunctional pyr operon transcriptional regulator/uracil phosphoribosyltransferase PyrR [Gammaproteobacteria bacterium]|nr:bifunctional pyr operon transcriptional regulator/uracil phosphoribosyltransferase PyrR [Gammaproteobacteria bacterium]